MPYNFGISSMKQCGSESTDCRMWLHLAVDVCIPDVNAVQQTQISLNRSISFNMVRLLRRKQRNHIFSSCVILDRIK